MGIVIKRIYEPASPADGAARAGRPPVAARRQQGRMPHWMAGCANWRRRPQLRRWFGHEPARWEGFRHRYAAELDRAGGALAAAGAACASHHRLTLLYAARDEEHNHALALKIYLDNWLRTHGPR